MAIQEHGPGETGAVAILRGLPDGGMGTAEYFGALQTGPEFLDAADFNRDGRIDLLTNWPSGFGSGAGIDGVQLFMNVCRP